MSHRQNKEYYNIVNDILANKEFTELDKAIHHGTSRLDHSLKVSYYSYVIAKRLGLNYEDTARGGLLHDFYFDKAEKNFKETIKEAFVHPSKSVDNAKKHFAINNKQEDIIKTHMFPYSLYNFDIPVYAESWVVSIVDKGVAVFEFFRVYKHQLSYAVNYLFLFIIINILKLH